jgi:hypothetical protein
VAAARGAGLWQGLYLHATAKTLIFINVMSGIRNRYLHAGTAVHIGRPNTARLLWSTAHVSYCLHMSDNHKELPSNAVCRGITKQVAFERFHDCLRLSVKFPERTQNRPRPLSYIQYDAIIRSYSVCAGANMTLSRGASFLKAQPEKLLPSLHLRRFY